MSYDSKAERDSAPIIASLGGKHCPSFEPLLPKTYKDANGIELEGRPDFLIKRGRIFTFIDTKSGKLNFHRTRESSHNALKEAYREVFHRCGDALTYSQLSSALYAHSRRGELLALEHGFNHSLYKLLALQAEHSWQRFIVVFKRNPTKKDAIRYINAGLVFCTEATLDRMMMTIELLQHGWYIPFQLKTRTYSFTVTADPATKGLTSQKVYTHDRAKYLAAVAADAETEKALRDAEASDWTTEILPF